MGNAPDAIPRRLARGGPTDIIVLARSALDKFTAGGMVRPDIRVDLGESRIGAVVRVAAPEPRISTIDTLRQTLLAAPSAAYSASASGVYISTGLYKRLGVKPEVTPMSRRILSECVSAVAARGEAEIGFQQSARSLACPGSSLSVRLHRRFGRSPCSQPEC